MSVNTNLDLNVTKHFMTTCILLYGCGQLKKKKNSLEAVEMWTWYSMNRTSLTEYKSNTRSIRLSKRNKNVMISLYSQNFYNR